MDKRERVIVAAEQLRRFTSDVFARAGMSEAHAATVADALVWANLRGMDSHGIARVPRDVEWMMPGERGRRMLERRTREGILLPPVVVAELSNVADALGVTMFAV